MANVKRSEVDTVARECSKAGGIQAATRWSKRRKTSWRMRPAMAREQHPGAEPDLSSREVRAKVGGAGNLAEKA